MRTRTLHHNYYTYPVAQYILHNPNPSPLPLSEGRLRGRRVLRNVRPSQVRRLHVTLLPRLDLAAAAEPYSGL